MPWHMKQQIILLYVFDNNFNKVSVLVSCLVRRKYLFAHKIQTIKKSYTQICYQVQTKNNWNDKLCRTSVHVYLCIIMSFQFSIVKMKNEYKWYYRFDTGHYQNKLLFRWCQIGLFDLIFTNSNKKKTKKKLKFSTIGWKSESETTWLSPL